MLERVIHLNHVSTFSTPAVSGGAKNSFNCGAGPFRLTLIWQQAFALRSEDFENAKG